MFSNFFKATQLLKGVAKIPSIISGTNPPIAELNPAFSSPVQIQLAATCFLLLFLHPEKMTTDPESPFIHST